MLGIQQSSIVHPSALYLIPNTRPIDETNLRQGFPNCTLTYMIALCVYLECTPASNNMFNVLTALAFKIIPGISSELLATIYILRAVIMEPDDDGHDLMQYECVLDAFDETERKAVEAEIKSAKGSKSEHAVFRSDYKKWKVCHLQDRQFPNHDS